MNRPYDEELRQAALKPITRPCPACVNGKMQHRHTPWSCYRLSTNSKDFFNRPDSNVLTNDFLNAHAKWHDGFYVLSKENLKCELGGTWEDCKICKGTGKLTVPATRCVFCAANFNAYLARKITQEDLDWAEKNCHKCKGEKWIYDKNMQMEGMMGEAVDRFRENYWTTTGIAASNLDDADYLLYSVHDLALMYGRSGDLAKIVNPDALARYLEQHGWYQYTESSSGNGGNWAHATNGEYAASMYVPARPETSRYEGELLSVLRRLSEIEQRDPAFILSEILVS